MNCLYPRTRYVEDSLSGVVRRIIYPCGHCVNCIAAEQDKWSIRLYESAKAAKGFIYDTLTVKPGAMPEYIDFTKPDEKGKFYGSCLKFDESRLPEMKKSYHKFIQSGMFMGEDSYKLLQKNDFKVPVFTKDVLQKWVKRGREQYKRDKGYRCTMSYFFAEEYGPQTSRPHFHIMVFGISFPDYMKYFGNRWREDYGWTKPSYIPYAPGKDKDFNCVTKYVSKYIVKDEKYQSPLVRDHIQPPAFKLVSKGIGEGYLNASQFEIFKQPELVRWRKFHMPSSAQIQKKYADILASGCCEECKSYKLSELEDYVQKCESDIDYAFDCQRKGEGCDLSHLTERDIQSLTVYYDKNGIPHKLPEYYKNKLFKNSNNEKNIYQFEIQNLLEQSNLLHINQDIQRFALTLGILIPDKYLTQDSEFWDIPGVDVPLLLDKYNADQRGKASTQAERRYIRLKNFHNRSLMNSAPALL